MGWFLTFLLYVGFTVVGELLRPRPKFERPQPAGLGDFTLPTAEAGRAIPILWGRCKVKGPNVTWYGDLEVTDQFIDRIRVAAGMRPREGAGYAYYLGAQLALCNGPIDSVVEILFDDKSVFGGSIVVESGKNGLRFGNVPPPWYTATIPAGTYATMSDLGVATEDAMQTAYGGGTWKVIYGYNFILGRSSKLVYAVKVAGVAGNYEVDIAGSYRSGGHAAFALQAAMNKSEKLVPGGPRVAWKVFYSEKTRLFKISYFPIVTIEGVYIRGIVDYDESALPGLGFQMGQDQFVSGTGNGSFESGFETRATRFTFAFGGLGGKIDWGAAETTCASLFGPGTTAQVTIKNFLCGQDRIGPSWTNIQDLDGERFRVVVNAPELFGGDLREGGIQGTIDLYKGTTTQVGDDYLEAVLATDLPGYRGVCYAVFRHLYIGTTSYPKHPAFVLQRCPNQLGLAGGDHVIGGADANPACMIYEALTNTRWGCAIPTGLIDTANFQAVGAVLADEAFGLSMLVDNQASAADLVAEICRHVDGTVYTDPATGKLKLVLARNDYDVEAIPDADVTNVSSCELSRPALEETINTVKVRYVGRTDRYTDRIAQAQNLANVWARDGDIAVEEYPFRGIASADLAQLVAARVLKTVSYPLARLDLTMDRTAWNIRPGSVFKLTWEPLGITDMVCRVTRISLGEPRDGKIRIDAVEDIFGVTWTAYESPGSAWTDPSAQPARPASERVEEAPYPQAGGEARKIITMLARSGSGTTDGYEVWSDDTGGAVYVETQDVTKLTPLGTLSEDLAAGGTEIIVAPVRDVEKVGTISAAAHAAGANILVVDDEWIAFQTVTENEDGTITLGTVARGVVDTAPRAHEAGASIFFLTAGSGFTKTGTYSADGDVSVKLLPYNAQGMLAIDLAEPHTVTLDSRAFRPFCPTAFRVNGVSYPDTVSGDLVLTWSHRDRTDTWEYDDSGATAAIETATHHRVRIYNEAGTLLHTETPVAGTTFTYTQAAELSDNGGVLADSLRVVVDTLEDSPGTLVSWQEIDHTMTRADAGDDGGSAYGTTFCGPWGV